MAGFAASWPFHIHWKPDQGKPLRGMNTLCSAQQEPKMTGVLFWELRSMHTGAEGSQPLGGSALGAQYFIPFLSVGQPFHGHSAAFGTFSEKETPKWNVFHSERKHGGI
ncbi:hypothetical protein Y1Q_0023822 [Alligator mississippiensis]|uniref:Uncharacterized protein n=1 Tax=Alligator mississippiensis TaxID=8496 RepID=A0A151MKR6_ALLMI|nr:hypothetical protein Y1Q_0023822 [Alligator mississippiensis]